jgi:hypothetical protein
MRDRAEGRTGTETILSRRQTRGVKGPSLGRPAGPQARRDSRGRGDLGRYRNHAGMRPAYR